jgi:hypothetical protein
MIYDGPSAGNDVISTLCGAKHPRRKKKIKIIKETLLFEYHNTINYNKGNVKTKLPPNYNYKIIVFKWKR